MKEMPLLEHLEELRKTIIRVVLILIGSFLVTYYFSDQISEFLLHPLRLALGQSVGGKIIYTGILDKVLSQFQVAFWSCVLVSSPLWFWEVWRFVRPGLYEHEARAVRPFILVGFLLFWAGVAFGHFVVFPVTFKVLLEMGVQNVEAMIGLKDYLMVASKVLVFLGLIFQLPNILLVLGFMGLVTKYSLRSMRRYIYVILAVVSAILTPPDVITMMALWVPLALLYEVGVLAVALIVHPYLARIHNLPTKV